MSRRTFLRRSRLIASLTNATALLAILMAPAAARAAEAIDIGSRRELFVDDHLIERLDGARLELHHPARAEIALELDRPWEGRFCGYFTVIKDGPLYRMYYRGMPELEAEEVTCYAESHDGVNWTRPDLGLYEISGTRENNVILAENRACHNFAPFIDTRPGVPSGERFKALGGTGKAGLLAFTSGDGINWRQIQDEAVITKGAFDSQNVAFWSESEGQYVCYFRTWDGVRTVSRATSSDFLNWSEPVAMTYGDTTREHLYTNQTTPYFRAPHIYVALPMRFMPGRRAISEAQGEAFNVRANYRNDCGDGVLMTSRGGSRYDRTFMEAFFRPGRDAANWGSRSNYAACGVVPTADDEMSIYYSQHYAQPTANLLRTTLRTDGFISIHGPYGGGELITRPLRFDGATLAINYSTSAAGSLRVELQDADGDALAGFALEDCAEMIGDHVGQTVTWKSGADVTALASKAIRLRVVLADADLYSFRFVPAAGDSAAREPTREPQLVDVKKIWDAGAHNAFTDLVRRDDRWFCVFREGTGHVSPDGAIRVLTSADGDAWKSAALVTMEGEDLRDPKITTTPDGRLMLTAAAARRAPDEPRHQTQVWFSPDGRQWSEPREIGDLNYWVWRVVWNDSDALAVGYRTNREDPHVRLYESADGVRFETLVPRLFDAGYANETSLVFLPDDTALCLLRRDGDDGTAQLGTAEPPYTNWSWKDLGHRLGGPHMIRLDDGRIVTAGRRYDGDVRTSLAWLDPERGTLDEFLSLPSGGDTSYPGLVWHDGLLWVSYYASHEGKTSIYLAKVRLQAAS